MRAEVVPGSRLAERVAARLALHLRAAVAARGTASLAVSGGATPAAMFAVLARLEVPWARVHLLQVDERIAPADDPARNLTSLREALIRWVPLPPEHVHPMPVDVPGLDAVAAARRYEHSLRAVAGSPPVLDVVHLGLGSDGHVASLVPGDPALAVLDRDVAATGAYRGHRRLTLTFPALDRARRLVWMVAGADKAGAVARLRAGDATTPAGRVRGERAEVFLDEAAHAGA